MKSTTPNLPSESNPNCKPKTQLELLPSPPSPKIVLEIKGLGKVPSFKNAKRAFAWMDKKTGKIMARPITLPEHREWMQKAARLFESQLRSAFQIATGATPMDASLRSLIASLPPDDCWTAIPEHFVKCELCESGNEGATIVIERL